jgi:hypothetical protein
LDNFEKWMDKFLKMCDFIDKNCKKPSQTSKNLDEKKLGQWICNQNQTYNLKGSEFSTHIMKNPDVWQVWNEIIKDEKYSNFLIFEEFKVWEWKNKHNKMCEFIDDNQRRPSQKSKDQTEKKIATWIGTQKHNYNPKGSEFSKQIMQNHEIFEIWAKTIEDEKYGKFLIIDSIQNWNIYHKKICDFIDKNRRRPSQTSKNLDEKKLGRWMCNQNQTYNLKGSEFSTLIMKNPEVWQVWTETIKDEKYSNFLIFEEFKFWEWKNKHNKMCEFIHINKRIPFQNSKNKYEKTLGSWIETQKINYNPKGPEFSKIIMKNAQIWKIWTETIEDEEYSKFLNFLLVLFQNWRNKLNKMCEFIDMNGKIPSQHSKNTFEKTLGCWISNQKQNYNPKGSEFSKKNMKNSEIWKIWNFTINDPKYNKFLNKNLSEAFESKSGDVSQSFPIPRKRKISTEVQKSQSKSKFPKKDLIMSEESESEDSFQSSSLPQKRRFQ